jgi:hypothetical protein
VIARRYGTKLHSVQPNFDAHALNEIGFMRDQEWSADASEFFETHEKTEAHELTAAAEGDVQGEAEAALLNSLQEQLLAVEKAGDGGVVVVESEQGSNFPKTRHTQTTKNVEGMTRSWFRFTVEPPLHVAVYRPRS